MKKLHQDNSRLQDQNNRLRAQYNRLATHVRRLNEEKKNLIDDGEKLTQSLAETNAKLQDVVAKFEDTRKQLADSQDWVKQLESSLAVVDGAGGICTMKNGRGGSDGATNRSTGSRTGTLFLSSSAPPPRLETATTNTQ